MVHQTAGPTALSIGNFDGVHRGHVALIRAARKMVGAGGRVVAVTFDPHPRQLLRPDAAPVMISKLSERLALLREAGADHVEVIESTPALLELAPGEFLARLAEQFSPSAIVQGPDFRFGHKRAGTVETLAALAPEFGYQAVVIDPVEAVLSDQQTVRVSSSLVRRLLLLGRVRDAAILLGRPFSLNEVVVRGDQQGRVLGVPTANLDRGTVIWPADGVYAGVGVAPDGARYPAAISVGDKPTLKGSSRVCEAHLIDFDGALDDYGWTIRLEFHDWLREQLAFENLESLVEQMTRDIERVRVHHARVSQTMELYA